MVVDKTALPAKIQNTRKGTGSPVPDSSSSLRGAFLRLIESVSLQDADNRTHPIGAPMLHNKGVRTNATSAPIDMPDTDAADYRLRKHADYQRVYREGRKQFSSSMSYFYALRSATSPAGPRVGLTAGKVLGKAVERNRIKRRMRDIVRRRIDLVSANVDIVLHPKRSVLTADFSRLESEVVRIFTIIQSAIAKGVTPLSGSRANS
jgi:ribonuclease P protein component